jgi:PAS domain S-box-containing protein
VQKSQETARSGSEQHTIDILEGIGEAFFSLDWNWHVVYFNRACEGFFGRPRDEVLGRIVWDIYPETIGTEFQRRYMAAMADRSPVEFETESAVRPGHWLAVRAFPIRQGLGVAFRDVSGRRQREAALRESEARFRHMADSAPALIWMTDAEGRLTFANMHYDYMFGIPAREMHDRGWRRVILPEDLPAYEAAFAEAFRTRTAFRGEVRVRDRNQEVRWLRSEGVPRLDDSGRFLGYTGCSVDITDVRIADERQRLLINELNHRVKNTLSTVQSVVAQTLRSAETPGQAREDIEDRLIALSRAHNVLTRENWESADLRDIVDQAIEPYRGGDRFRTEGPNVRLQPQMALALAMALHELATNAVKYGALSNTAGRVNIAWRIEPGLPPRLHLVWRETGGPPVQPPSRRGFGSRLIERSLAQDLVGEAVINFAPDGVTCTVDAPLAR